jgi:hypothetical protein
MRWSVMLGVLLVAIPHAASGQSQDTDLRTVLKRAGAYVADFSSKLSGMVAEESYIQDVEAGSSGGRSAEGVSHRALKSDFLLVRPAGQTRYVEFRDVFEVDGVQVRDRPDRLMHLFLNSASSGPQQVAAIVAESARYNIGRVLRTVNTPMLPLQFLLPDVQDHFAFKRSTQTMPANMKAAENDGHFRVTAEVWVIEYREKAHGTVVRTPAGKDLPAHGRFWVDPATGRVLMSELLTEDISANIEATIDESYQSEPLLGLSVPAEMRERYNLGLLGVVTGTATYGGFRQFSVRTEEDIGRPVR